MDTLDTPCDEKSASMHHSGYYTLHFRLPDMVITDMNKRTVEKLHSFDYYLPNEENLIGSTVNIFDGIPHFRRSALSTPKHLPCISSVLIGNHRLHIFVAGRFCDDSLANEIFFSWYSQSTLVRCASSDDRIFCHPPCDGEVQCMEQPSSFSPEYASLKEIANFDTIFQTITKRFIFQNISYDTQDFRLLQDQKKPLQPNSIQATTKTDAPSREYHSRYALRRAKTVISSVCDDKNTSRAAYSPVRRS